MITTILVYIGSAVIGILLLFAAKGLVSSCSDYDPGTFGGRLGFAITMLGVVLLSALGAACILGAPVRLFF